MKDNVKLIKENNKKANELIAKIVQKYKDVGLTAFNENDELDDNIRKIIEMEMKRNVLIYLCEFPQFEEVNLDNIMVEVETREGKKNQADARGSSNGVKVYPGMQKFLDTLHKLGLEAAEIDGAIFATKIFGSNNGIMLPNHVTGKMIDSKRDYADYFAEVLKEGKIDIDWILDVLPHESMHVFIDGQGTLVEGTTERFTRECADKYGLRMTPTSHSKEAELISKIEKIIGREELAKAMRLTNEEKNERDSDKIQVDNKRLKRIERLIDAKLGNGTFKVLQESFEKEYKRAMTEGKRNPIAYRGYYKQENEFLDNWIVTNIKENLDIQGIEVQRDSKKLERVIEFQNVEIEKLNEIINQLAVRNRFTKKEVSLMAREESILAETENAIEDLTELEKENENEQVVAKE